MNVVFWYDNAIFSQLIKFQESVRLNVERFCNSIYHPQRHGVMEHRVAKLQGKFWHKMKKDWADSL